MLGTGKGLQISTYFRHQDLGNPPIDAGQRIPALQAGFKRAHLFLDLGIQTCHRFIQKVNVTQVLRQHETMVITDPAL